MEALVAPALLGYIAQLEQKGTEIKEQLLFDVRKVKGSIGFSCRFRPSNCHSRHENNQGTVFITSENNILGLPLLVNTDESIVSRGMQKAVEKGEPGTPRSRNSQLIALFWV